MWLDFKTFQIVVGATPLIAIDLIIQNQHGDILLGQRLNRPAHNFWFVPGGRILKNETLDAAFRRITLTELGRSIDRDNARLLNVYEHFYKDSVFGEGEGSPDTHYVVLGYCIKMLDVDTFAPPKNQHAEYRWWSFHDAKSSQEVHNNSRAYFDAIL